MVLRHLSDFQNSNDLKMNESQVQWCMPIIFAFWGTEVYIQPYNQSTWRLRQEGYFEFKKSLYCKHSEFQSSLGHRERLSQKITMRLYINNLSNISLQGNAIVILLYLLSEVLGKPDFLNTTFQAHTYCCHFMEQFTGSTNNCSCSTLGVHEQNRKHPGSPKADLRVKKKPS